MRQALLVLLCLVLPSDAKAPRKGGESVIEDVVDVIEVNHFMNSNGECHLSQIIFWGYSVGLGEYVVIDWRSYKHPTQLPMRRGDWYETTWKDSRDNVIRRVVAKSRRETWTLYDPEQVSQELVPRNERIGLTKKEGKK